MNDDKTMLAAVFERAGRAEEVVQLRSVPIPAPGPGEVLVRMEAASLHPADRMFIGGAYRSRPVFPQRAGLVGAGAIVQAGATVDLPAGTRVAFRQPGAWAQYCVVAAERLFVVPEGIDAAAAGQFALNPITAWGLLEASGVGAGDWLALNAAASNVALMVRALAEARGVRVLDVPRWEPGDARFAQRLLAATGDTPIAALLDAVGGPALHAVLPTLRQGATIVSYGLLDDAPAPVRNADLVYRNLTWTGFGIDHWLARHAAQRDAMLRSLWDAIAARTLPLPVRATYPLESLTAALRDDAAGGAGKVLLTFGDAA